MGRGAWRATVHGVTKESDMTERAQWLGLRAFITMGPGWIPGWGANVNRKQKQRKTLPKLWDLPVHASVSP